MERNEYNVANGEFGDNLEVYEISIHGERELVLGANAGEALRHSSLEVYWCEDETIKITRHSEEAEIDCKGLSSSLFSIHKMKTVTPGRLKLYYNRPAIIASTLYKTADQVDDGYDQRLPKPLIKDLMNWEAVSGFGDESI